MILNREEKALMQKKYIIRVLLLSLITAALSIVPFMFANGGLFTLRDDFDYQQIIFSMFCNSSVKSGELGWSWYTDLGSSFIGSYSFYNLGSPFMWLSMILPASAIPYATGILIMIKYCVAALLSYLYISRFVKNKNYAVMGALMYAFCGFQTMNLLFPFHDVTALFPLLLIGVEELVEKRRFGVLTFAVAISAMLNYYFLFGQIIFAIIYFIFRFLLTDFKKYIKVVPKCLFEGLLGAGIASFYFIPSVLAVLDNPRLGSLVSAVVYDWQTYLMIMRAYFIPADVMGSQAYFVNHTCDSCAIYLPLFAMTLVFGYMLQNRKSNLTKFMIFLAGVSLIPVLNAAFSMFNSRYYARWYYMAVLIFALASAMALDNSEENRRKNLKKGFILNAAATLLTFMACSGVIILSVLLELHIEDKINIKMTVFYGVLATAGLVITALCLCVKDTKRRIAAMMSGIMMFSIITTGLAIYRYKRGSDSGYWYNDSVETVSKAVDSKKLYESLVDFSESIELPDGQNYRIRTVWCDLDSEYIWHSYDNASMLLKVPSVNCFNSTVSGGIFEFYDALGIDRHVTSIDNNYPGLSELLSCRFYLTSAEEPGKTVVSRYTDSFGDTVYVYEYENFIPFGFCYDKYITHEEFLKYDTETKCLILLNAVVLDENQATVCGGLTEISPDEISVLSAADIPHYAAERNQAASSSFTRSSYGFKSVITSDKASCAYFSVPRDSGFTATVNGKAVEIINSNGMMVVPVEAGENVIEFTYKIPGLDVGFAISTVSFTAFVILWIVFKRKKSF
ncbi:MAG: YfhO family protein [Clostridia bacterium]|nr:YfhO family protein [Clostridia bacterium]